MTAYFPLQWNRSVYLWTLVKMAEPVRRAMARTSATALQAGRASAARVSWHDTSLDISISRGTNNNDSAQNLQFKKNAEPALLSCSLFIITIETNYNSNLEAVSQAPNAKYISQGQHSSQVWLLNQLTFPGVCFYSYCSWNSSGWSRAPRWVIAAQWAKQQFIFLTQTNLIRLTASVGN